MEKVNKFFEDTEKLKNTKKELMKGCGRKIDKEKCKFPDNICGRSIFICSPCSSKIRDISIGINKQKGYLFTYMKKLHKMGDLRERNVEDRNVGFTNLWADTRSFAVFYEEDLKNIFNGENTEAYINAIKYWKNKATQSHGLRKCEQTHNQDNQQKGEATHSCSQTTGKVTE